MPLVAIHILYPHVSYTSVNYIKGKEGTEIYTVYVYIHILYYYVHTYSTWISFPSILLSTPLCPPYTIYIHTYSYYYIPSSILYTLSIHPSAEPYTNDLYYMIYKYLLHTIHIDFYMISYYVLHIIHTI